jgi:hypothetical protein
VFRVELMGIGALLRRALSLNMLGFCRSAAIGAGVGVGVESVASSVTKTVTSASEF